METSNPFPKKARRTLALPSKDLFVWPLWIAPEGDPVELARMELSGRHLLKRGLEDSLCVQPILLAEDRRLVLAVATDEPFPSERMPGGWLDADAFVLPSQLLADASGSTAATELLIWKEHGELFAGFRREGITVWFARSTEETLPGLLRRTLLRLLSEGTLTTQPSCALLGGFREAEASRMGSIVASVLPHARRIQLPTDTPPGFHPRQQTVIPSPPDLAPTEVKTARIHRKNRERLFMAGGIAALFYILLLLWGAGDLLIRHTALAKLRHQVAAVKAPAAQAHSLSDRWNSLRPAVDPSTFPLDILAAVSAPTEGGKVRLISLILENGHLQIAGEATDVTQAYGLMEALKKDSLLQQFDWTTGQPQLAGKESVKFEMEGTRPHANP